MTSTEGLTCHDNCSKEASRRGGVYLVGSQEDQELREEQLASQVPILVIHAAVGDDCDGVEVGLTSYGEDVERFQCTTRGVCGTC